MVKSANRAFRSMVLRARNSRLSDAGASAIEWAVIAAISILAASVIGTVVYQVVQSKGSSLKDCANVASTGAQCGGGVAAPTGAAGGAGS